MRQDNGHIPNTELAPDRRPSPLSIVPDDTADGGLAVIRCRKANVTVAKVAEWSAVPIHTGRSTRGNAPWRPPPIDVTPNVAANGIPFDGMRLIAMMVYDVLTNQTDRLQRRYNTGGDALGMVPVGVR